jgi:hypothetical protein
LAIGCGIEQPAASCGYPFRSYLTLQYFQLRQSAAVFKYAKARIIFFMRWNSDAVAYKAIPSQADPAKRRQ